MTVRVMGRDEWGGGRLRSGHLVDHAQFVGLVAHHTVFVMSDWDGDGFLHGDLDDIKRYMRTLQHARPDLGDEVPYSWVVFEGAGPEDCVLAEGRGFGVTGAHTTGYNSTRYGVAVAGNTSTRPITPGMLEGYRWVGRHLADPADAQATIGHRDTKSTECPGSSMYAALPQVQPPFTTEEDDMPDINEIKNAVREVLNEGTGKGQRNWAGTSKAQLDGEQDNFRLLVGQDDRLKELIRVVVREELDAS